MKFIEEGQVSVKVTGQIAEQGFEIHFSIRDTGIGIPSEGMGYLFETSAKLMLRLLANMAVLGLA